jgi:hypothetical protein
MKRMVALLLLFACAGCSVGVHSGLLDVEMRLASPLLFGEAERLPVHYPATAGRGGAAGDAMVEAFGPSWRNVEGDFPSYRFNP